MLPSVCPLLCACLEHLDVVESIFAFKSLGDSTFIGTLSPELTVALSLPMLILSLEMKGFRGPLNVGIGHSTLRMESSIGEFETARFSILLLFLLLRILMFDLKHCPVVTLDCLARAGTLVSEKRSSSTKSKSVRDKLSLIPREHG